MTDENFSRFDVHTVSLRSAHFAGSVEDHETSNGAIMIDLLTLLTGLRADGDTYQIAVSEDWLQGRTTFGGLSAAICVESTLRQYADLPPLRSAQFTFVGPATGLLSVRPAILRQGSSTTFVGVDLSGAAGLATRATLCFGSARSSAIHHPPVMAPQTPDRELCQPFFDSRAPLVTQHFDCLRAGGALPLDGSPNPNYQVWLRHRGSAPQSITGLVAVADALPPAALVLSKQIAPLSTVSWMIDVLTDQLETSDGWWLIEASADNAADGYSSQAMTIWNASGRAVAHARQDIAIFI
ncbi:acyl-CoA thioesterase [Bradyrhizobium sp. USDA 4503]